MKIPVALTLLAVGLAVSPVSHAAQWHALVGAQSSDLGHQALAFLPDEIWVHAGDGITWTFPADEIHTLSLLVANSARPGFPAGCGGTVPGTAPSGSSFDGSHCINSGALLGGQSYSVNFPAAGNYKLVCLVHEGMTATIHVLPASSRLPHTQGSTTARSSDFTTNCSTGVPTSKAR